MSEPNQLLEQANLIRIATATKHTLTKRIATLPGSWLSYLTRLFKEDGVIYWSILDKPIAVVSAPKKVVISPCFFRDFSCTCCGLCCKKINTFLFYTMPEIVQYGIDTDMLLRLGFDPVEITFENLHGERKRTQRTLFVSSWNIHEGGCPWLREDNKCAINDIKPIQCRLTPIHVDWTKSSSSARLTKRLFGRNWKFGCQMTTKPSTPAVLDYDLSKLITLNSIALDYKLDTWLSTIIARLSPCVNSDHALWHHKSSFVPVVIKDATHSEEKGLVDE